MFTPLSLDKNSFKGKERNKFLDYRDDLTGICQRECTCCTNTFHSQNNKCSDVMGVKAWRAKQAAIKGKQSKRKIGSADTLKGLPNVQHI